MLYLFLSQETKISGWCTRLLLNTNWPDNSAKYLFYLWSALIFNSFILALKFLKNKLKNFRKISFKNSTVTKLSPWTYLKTKLCSQIKDLWRFRTEQIYDSMIRSLKLLLERADRVNKNNYDHFCVILILFLSFS